VPFHGNVEDARIVATVTEHNVVSSTVEFAKAEGSNNGILIPIQKPSGVTFSAAEKMEEPFSDAKPKTDRFEWRTDMDFKRASLRDLLRSMFGVRNPSPF